MAEELVLLTRLFDLLAWLVPRSETFPRPFRHTVTQRLLCAALDCQEAVFQAQSVRGAARQQALAKADASLNALRLYLRLAHHWRWLNDGQYEHVSARVAEIGRLLGGWLKRGQDSSARVHRHRQGPDVGNNTQPKPEPVVAVVGRVVVATGRAQVPGVVVPRTTAHHPGRAQAALRTH